jgi:predicted lipid-binding transport protein (Tim44 family)
MRMGDGFQFLDIILLAMVAGFILLRLRSVLGRRTGNEQQRPSPLATGPTTASDDGKVVPLPRRDDAPAAIPAGPAAAGLHRIQAMDRGFDPAVFVAGARSAYEMIVTAFAQGDTATLKQFLARDVYADFESAIRQRQQQGQRQETTLVGVNAAEIVDADLKGKIAEVTVKVVSDLINVTRDKTGQVVAGNPNAVEAVTDIWTFARDVSSNNPNWTLIATSTPS